MGKYFASPWGFIRGKIGDIVGGYWRGTEWARINSDPAQRGTAKLYKQFKAGKLSPDKFSFEQLNYRTIVFQSLNYIATNNRPNLISPIWESARKKLNLPLTGVNLFIKQNSPIFWNSFPSQNTEFHPISNSPDISKILLSNGILESVEFTAETDAFTYDPLTGNCIFKWDTAVFKNGSPDDYVYTFLFIKPIIDSSFNPKGTLYGRADIVPFSRRKDGTVTTTIPLKNLSPSDVFGYIFARDENNSIGFSVSTGKTAKEI